MTRLSGARFIAEKRAIVICGAGGVGKTSVSAAVALSAARLGRNVLVITIDPSRRLAEVLGVSQSAPRPVELDRGLLTELGVPPAGSLSAWILNPKAVTDSVVHRLSPTPGKAKQLLANHLYQHVSSMIAGMQEYAAVEAVHHYVTGDHYELVVLDTPPARNALQFLTAPDRVGSFLNPKILSLFLPASDSRIRRAARLLLFRILDIGLGTETSEQLQQFLVHFGEILLHENKNAQVLREFFGQSAVAFFVVTAPAREALTEAFYFEDVVRKQLGFQLDGYILNRSLAGRDCCRMPADLVDGHTDRPDVVAALDKLTALAQRELELTQRHQSFHDTLTRRAGSRQSVMALPYLIAGVSDMASLVALADVLGDAR